MKSFFLTLGALLIVSLPANASFEDHGSSYALPDGTSRFSDPGDPISPNQFGTVQFGNFSSDDTGTGTVEFGTPAENRQTTEVPELVVQGCLPGKVCLQ